MVQRAKPVDLFDAKAGSLYEVMSDHGNKVGFRIPEYQRKYHWAESNIKRLLEDCLSGFRNCWDGRNGRDFHSFLGTIILVDEGKRKEPGFAGTSLAVVDGQQRLTSLCLLCCALIEALCKHLHTASRFEQSTQQWLLDETDYRIDLLKECINGEFRSKGRTVRIPRIVRATDDSRSEAEIAGYHSSIATFFFEFGDYADNSQSIGHKNFKPSWSRKRNYPADFKRLEGNFEYIRTQLDLALCRPSASDSRYRLDIDRGGLTDFWRPGVRRLFERLPDANGPGNPAQIMQDLTRASDDCALALLLSFAGYVTDRVVLARVEADDEEYAFDIFDSLNTTGEPLTAIETFRPAVMAYAKGLSAPYDGSVWDTELTRLSMYLEDLRPKTGERQAETKELLISHALYLEGHRLGKSLNVQRFYVKSRFDGSSDQLRPSFVKSLADLAEFRWEYWTSEQIKSLSTVAEGDVLSLCFSVLKAIGVSLVLPPLARYWVAMKEDQLEHGQFIAAVKALTAYVILRRAMTGGTDNIDRDLRSLMQDKSAAGGAPLCVGIEWGNKLYDVAALRKELRDTKLQGSLDASDRGHWVGRAASTPIADQSQPIARFLLFAASHQARPDPASPGLITRTQVKNTTELNYLSTSRWYDPLHLEVEHVAPVTDSRGGWDPTIYSDDLKHTIGNLTLLPPKANKEISNRQWSWKQLCYRVLSAPTEAKEQEAIQRAKAEGVDFRNGLGRVVTESGRLLMVESLGDVKEWDREFIQRRSERLLELAWDTIWPWLED